LVKGKIIQDAIRILVVDDDVAVADSLVLVFHCAGIKALAVYSAEEARDAFALFCPNLVLIDVLLPDGNGVELATAFRRLDHACRTLLFSGQVTPEDLRRMALERSGITVLSKPLNPKHLLDLITTLFEYPPAATA
jgi:DNA-binding response OmpR family regulator